MKKGLVGQMVKKTQGEINAKSNCSNIVRNCVVKLCFNKTNTTFKGSMPYVEGTPHMNY